MITKLSYKIFGPHVRILRKYFLDIKRDLHRAGIRITLEEYLSTALLTTIISFVAETLILSFIFGLFFDLPIALMLSFTISIAISGFIFFLFYSYPAAAAAGRAKEINAVLPFAVSYLTAISSGKVQPAVMFKTLSRLEEFGEVAKESKEITKNIEMFGMTVSDALRKATEKTPSNEFKDVLFGINTTITSGGDLMVYLRNKTDELMDNYRRTLVKYSQDLSLFVEIYLTLIITGSIFFIVLSSIMSVISGGMITAIIQTFVVFVLLPLISIGFIVLLKTLSPTE